MRGIELPAPTEDFTADPVELFFDLAYVFAFSQLVSILIVEPTWSGVGKAALLFGLLWLPWQQLTWAANAVSGNGRKIRVIFLAATVLSIPMAAATSTALEGGGLVFALSLSGIMILGFFIQALGSSAGTAMRLAVVWWIAPNVISIAVLTAGGVAEGAARRFLWVITLILVLGAMILAGNSEWLIRIGHMAERHALIVIIALGEVIVAIGIPVANTLQEQETLPVATVGALVAAGLFAGLLWWSYFDRPGPGLEHRGHTLLTDRERGRYVRDVYTWSHAPIVAGIMLSAAALEEIALHPLDPVSTSFRTMLAGGLLMIATGISSAVWRANGAVAAERIVATFAIAGFVLAAASINGVSLLGMVVAMMLIGLTIEAVRIDRTGSVSPVSNHS
ncbi:MAG TPA: low temperature requirement protein A [Acidimicrobiia bacterium]